MRRAGRERRRRGKEGEVGKEVFLQFQPPSFYVLLCFLQHSVALKSIVPPHIVHTYTPPITYIII
jgi:hypothetical protein